MARDNTDSVVKSCTGSLISASLVLTSGQCVLEKSTKEKLHQFAVILAKPSQQEFRSTAKLLELNVPGGWALLRIPPQNITELCPPSPAPKWVARLNFRPSLSGNPRLDTSHLDLGSDSGSGCNLIGFKTTEKAENFLTDRRVIRLFLDRMERSQLEDRDDDEAHYASNTYDDFIACYDDAGAPVMCSYQDQDVIQLGLFQLLIVPGGVIKSSSAEEGTEDPLAKCRRARQMHFSLFHEDDALAQAIERHALAEFVSVYQECGFLN